MAATSIPTERRGLARHPILCASACLAVLAALAFAGCVGDSGGSAKLSFDGSGNGSHSDETECDDDGTLVASGNVDAGQVTVRVTDGDGRELYEETFDGGVNLDSEGLDGASGDWRVQATRSSDAILSDEFSGDYSFKLSC